MVILLEQPFCFVALILDLKKDMHKPSKCICFTPSYSIKHPTIKVELQNLGNRRIETDIFKTITMDSENFEFISDIKRVKLFSKFYFCSCVIINKSQVEIRPSNID